VGGETAYVFTTVPSGGSDPSTTTDLMAKRPSGVYSLADQSIEPPLDQALPALILPFPVAVMPRTLQFQCTDVDVGDLDNDGRHDHADLTGHYSVLSVTETANLGPGGSYTDVAHSLTEIAVTLRMTSLGSVTTDVYEDDWFARDVGRIVTHATSSGGGLSLLDETDTLLSYSVPGAAGAPITSRAAVVPGAPRPQVAEEDVVVRAAMRLARQLLPRSH
jgi:hypothetical protein